MYVCMYAYMYICQTLPLPLCRLFCLVRYYQDIKEIEKQCDEDLEIFVLVY